jgi:hypothetical protein
VLVPMLHGYLLRSKFQSSPDPEAGCWQRRSRRTFKPTWFQSSPDPEAGCWLVIDDQQHIVPGVPILTRPGGRVLEQLCRAARHHPDRSNPHPTRRPGAGDSCGLPLHPERPVPILTRPGGRVLVSSPSSIAARPSKALFQSSPDPEAGCWINYSYAAKRVLSVPILTRPGGRVLARW